MSDPASTPAQGDTTVGAGAGDEGTTAARDSASSMPSSTPVPTLNDAKLTEAIAAVQQFQSDMGSDSPRTHYNKLRSEREKATFTLMMKLAPSELTAIRKEFFAREDSLQLNDFLYIIQLHLLKGMPQEEQKEFMSYMYELYKEVDVNGDGDMEWEELTTFIVQKANQLNKANKLSSISTYYDSSDNLDESAKVRRRDEYSHIVGIPSMNNIAAIEEHRCAVYIFNCMYGKLVHEMKTYSPPLCVCNIAEKNMLATACADMTILVSSTIDPVPAKQFQPLSLWPTVGSQMSLAWMPSNELLYSGSENGDIYAWRINDQSCQETLKSHSDMVLSLLALNSTNNLVSASMDATIAVWDTYTHQELFKLKGHRKGIFGLSYNPDFRLLVSCGFDHDAMVWSPFVKSLVFRLKGHHASLIGCQCIEDSPEIITADVDGVFKLWDIRNFNCVQSFSPAEALDRATKKAPLHLNCFHHFKLPSRNSMQKEMDARIFACSKKITSFDQTRIVHEATTDLTGVFWIAWNEESSVLLTASEQNLIVWDALLGSTTQRHSNICGEEITAVCLDDRQRKIVIGDVYGRINVYNPANGVLMKTCADDVFETVIDLKYICSTRRFVAGYANGLIRLYDETGLDDCPLIRNFEEFSRHPELLALTYSEKDAKTVATIGGASEFVRLWETGSGKCEVEIDACENSESIVTLTYLGDDSTILATSDSAGNIVLWGGRASRYVGKRIAGFMNHTTYLSELEQRRRSVDPDEVEPPRRAFPSAKGTEEYPEILQYEGEGLDQLDENSIGAANSSVSSLDHRGYSKVMMEMAQKEAEASELSWGRVAPAVTLAYDSESKSFYTGNDLGVLRKFSLAQLMDSLDRIEDMLDDEANEEMTHHDIFVLAAKELGPRDHTGALLPVYKNPVSYLFSDDPESVPILPNLGVSFCWHVQAHEERILNIEFTRHGVLTASADRMVKMWNFEGQPIGELLQNIPVGMRNPGWHLELDVVGIMQREDEELDEILKEVAEYALSDDIPDITTMDFSGLEPGAESAEFSRSELRQRIEKTSANLGINFPVEGADKNSRSEGGTLDDNSTVMTAMSGISSKLSSVYENKSLKGMPPAKKGIADALQEIKSTEPALRHEPKRITNESQERMQAVKMNSIADKFDEKAGVKLPSIKEKIKRKNQLLSGGGGSSITDDADNDEISMASMLTGGSSKKVSESLSGESATSSVLREAEKMTRAFNAAKSLERLTLPTPATVKQKNFLSSKCNKFGSFSALENALNKDNMTLEEKVQKSFGNGMKRKVKTTIKY